MTSNQTYLLEAMTSTFHAASCLNEMAKNEKATLDQLIYTQTELGLALGKIMRLKDRLQGLPDPVED